jgi:hypothetical protein
VGYCEAKEYPLRTGSLNGKGTEFNESAIIILFARKKE